MSELIAAIEPKWPHKVFHAYGENGMGAIHYVTLEQAEICRKALMKHEERAEKKHSYPEQNVPYFNPAIPPIHICKHCGKE